MYIKNFNDLESKKLIKVSKSAGLYMVRNGLSEISRDDNDNYYFVDNEEFWEKVDSFPLHIRFSVRRG